jgi:protein gp37
MARRLQAMGLPEYSDGFAVRCHPERLSDPARWKRPRRIFVCSMGDLFHEDVPDAFIGHVFWTMRCAHHAFQVLTKRASRMAAWFRRCELSGRDAESRGLVPMSWPLPNVALGVTCEDQERANQRIPLLLSCPAAVRFVSAEPLLEPVRLDRLDVGLGQRMDGMTGEIFSCDTGQVVSDSLPGLDWVIAGCESGPRARPMELDWVRALRDQCKRTACAFFLKQAIIQGRIVSTPMLDGRAWTQFPNGGSHE